MNHGRWWITGFSHTVIWRDPHHHRRAWAGIKRRQGGKIRPGGYMRKVDQPVMIQPVKRVPVGKRRERRRPTKP